MLTGLSQPLSSNSLLRGMSFLDHQMLAAKEEQLDLDEVLKVSGQNVSAKSMLTSSINISRSIDLTFA